MASKPSTIAARNVRTAWVKKWAEQFLEGLETVKTRDKIEAYCSQQKEGFEAEVKRLSKEKAEKQGKDILETSWMNAAATHMSQIRNAIKVWQQTSELGDSNSYPQQTKEGIVQQHYALLFMNYSRDMHDVRKQPTEQKKNQQRRNLSPIKFLDRYLQTIDVLLDSTDYRDLSAGLIAATGRRMVEILSTGSFTQMGQFEADFQGQAKAKGEEKSYPAYTLVESSKVIDAILRLRRMAQIKEMKNWNLKEIDSGKNNTVNRQVRIHFSELINPPHGEDVLSSKNLRAAYAAIAIYLFCPSNHSESLFIKERLGHTSDATASNYEDYQVVDVHGKQLPRGAWVQRIGEERSKPMQIETNVRIRMTIAAKEFINNQIFLLYPDQLSRVEELIRLAKIGKQYEEGKLVKEVVKVVEVVKEIEKVVEKPVEVIKEVIKEVEKIVQKPIETVREAQRTLGEIKPVEEVKPMGEVKSVGEIKATSTRFEEMSNEELRGCQAPGSALEKIRRSVRVIKTYNEQQAEKKHQWAINVSTLEDLSRCRSEAIRGYLDSDEGRLQVNDYNLEKGFGFQQNRGKGKITKFMNW